MNSRSKIELLSNIFAYINAEEYQASIINLSKDCKIPLAYTRKVISSMLKNRVIKSCLSDDDFSFMDRFEESPNETTKELINGKYDDVLWTIHFSLLEPNEQELLVLSHKEYLALGALGENASTIQKNALYEKKDNTSPISKDICKILNNIEVAIEQEKKIEFTYKKPNGVVEHVVCFPYKIVTNLSDNWLYMRSIEGKHYRLDRMETSCVIINDGEVRPQSSDREDRKYIWGIFGNSSDPVHVKVLIIPEDENTIIKIKNEINYRKETYTLYKKGNNYIYEDDVIGIDEFQRWVRSYGEAMVVLEPKDQQDEIIKRAHQTLDLYEQSKAWYELYY